MTLRWSGGALALPWVLAATMAAGGCGGEPVDNGFPKDVPQPVVAEAGPEPGAPGGGGPGGPPPGGGPGRPSKIGELMTKLAKGPNSLTPVLGKELKETPPPWDAIQPQAKEYAQLAAALGPLEPSKGNQESWAKLTAAYAASAADLEKAAQAKDSAAALEAHGKLANSCNECHQAHRTMGRPGGRMGGPGGGMMGGPGGPPPGGDAPK